MIGNYILVGEYLAEGELQFIMIPGREIAYMIIHQKETHVCCIHREDDYYELEHNWEFFPNLEQAVRGLHDRKFMKGSK